MRLLTLAVVVLAVAAAPARADHVAGATYYGTHSAGGTIELTLSADGKRVESYVARTIQGDTCSFVAEGDVGDWPGAAISDEAFEYRLYDAILFRGSFRDRLTATGTLRLYNRATDVKPACDTGTVTWTAKTTPSGDPPPGAPPTSHAPKLTPGMPTVATRVTLHRSRASLKGKLISANATCRGRRTVTLLRGTRKLRTAKAKADGSFSFRRTRSIRGRSVRVTVASFTGAAAICRAASSKRIKG